MKKIRRFGINIVIAVFLLSAAMWGEVIFSSKAKMASAANVTNCDIISNDAPKATDEILGNVKSSEFLYNFNDSPDYVYEEFTGSGYAVYFDETGELLEYSPEGTLPYPAGSRKYYAGPGNYMYREGECFVNSITKESAVISSVDAQIYSQKVTDTFANKEQAQRSYASSISAAQTTPQFASLSYDPWEPPGANDPGYSGREYIPNYNYFIQPASFGYGAWPEYGNNTNGTCASVAAQLLLSYNNYYNDRRIIAPEYLRTYIHGLVIRLSRVFE